MEKTKKIERLEKKRIDFELNIQNFSHVDLEEKIANITAAIFAFISVLILGLDLVWEKFHNIIIEKNLKYLLIILVLYLCIYIIGWGFFHIFKNKNRST